MGFAVKRLPTSPDHRFLHKARCNRLLGPHHDLEEMPPGHRGRFMPVWPHFYVVPGPLLSKLWACRPVERDTSTGHFHMPCLKHGNTLWSPEFHRDSGEKGMVSKNNPGTSSKVQIST